MKLREVGRGHDHHLPQSTVSFSFFHMIIMPCYPVLLIWKTKIKILKYYSKFNDSQITRDDWSSDDIYDNGSQWKNFTVTFACPLFCINYLHNIPRIGFGL